VTELTRLDAGMDLHLFHPVVEDPHAATIPAHPDLLTNRFSGYFIKGFRDFYVTVTVDIAPGFLVTGKERFRKRLKVGTFLFKTGSHLFACGAMDAFIGNRSFPVLEKEVFFGQ
jgi:hypothetical protein